MPRKTPEDLKDLAEEEDTHCRGEANCSQKQQYDKNGGQALLLGTRPGDTEGHNKSIGHSIERISHGYPPLLLYPIIFGPSPFLAESGPQLLKRREALSLR
jgi:hypothetical protein